MRAPVCAKDSMWVPSRRYRLQTPAPKRRERHERQRYSVLLGSDERITLLLWCN